MPKAFFLVQGLLFWLFKGGFKVRSGNGIEAVLVLAPGKSERACRFLTGSTGYKFAMGFIF